MTSHAEVLRGLEARLATYSEMECASDAEAKLYNVARDALTAIRALLAEREGGGAVLQDNEQYRLQMAGISTAALGYWKEGDSIHPDYVTQALIDVAKLYAKYDALYQATGCCPMGPKLPPPFKRICSTCKKEIVGDSYTYRTWHLSCESSAIRALLAEREGEKAVCSYCVNGSHGESKMKTWSCKIGEFDGELPDGSDAPMRQAVARAYKELTGRDCSFCFSGWGATLTEEERAVVEDREPDRPAAQPVQEPDTFGVARGWCHVENAKKVMDSDLAQAIAYEVAMALAAAPPPSAAGAQGRDK